MTIVFTGCGKSEDKVIEQFMYYLDEGDFERAEEYFVESEDMYKKLPTFIEGLGNIGIDEEDDSMEAINDNIHLIKFREFLNENTYDGYEIVDKSDSELEYDIKLNILNIGDVSEYMSDLESIWKAEYYNDTDKYDMIAMTEGEQAFTIALIEAILPEYCQSLKDKILEEAEYKEAMCKIQLKEIDGEIKVSDIYMDDE